MEEEIEMFPPLQDLCLEEDQNKRQEQEQDENLNRVKAIEEITGYKFHDPVLLQQAFTHHSYEEGCASFERLAFLGDSILNALITKEHYVSYPGLDPGKLTRLRAVNVDTEKLARVALKHQLSKFLRHNISLLSIQIKEFTEGIVEYPLHSSGLIDAPKVLADIVESLIGAIFIDSNFSMDTTWEIVKNLLEPIITASALPTHPVTQLREMCQKKGLIIKTRDFWAETGEIEFVIDEQFVGRGKFSAKRAVAKNRAAHNAYYKIVENFDPEKL